MIFATVRFISLDTLNVWIDAIHHIVKLKWISTFYEIKPMIFVAKYLGNIGIIKCLEISYIKNRCAIEKQAINLMLT